ncbi:hypothetical protein FTW19_12420 [Terriglobus albidus]|uniref:Uncharacterized protein n=1 Tax=Terriglobus albidus TaxID=1592106 RepID=A0A5B9E902_9BACT|nr:hypothetical protein FTW19_12420 [Terriglobus albidus]
MESLLHTATQIFENSLVSSPSFTAKRMKSLQIDPKMTLKTKYILSMAAFWGMATALGTNAWSIWVDHRPFSWIDMFLRLIVFCLAGLGFGALMWSLRGRGSRQ